MKALLHIGPPKTGSTTIQAFLRRNRTVLENNRVATYAHADWVRIISALFRSDPPKGYWAQTKGIRDKELFASFKTRWLKRLKSEIDKCRGKAELLVISVEGLFYREHEEILALKRFFDQYCEPTKIIAYLRRQDFLSLSMQKNYVRNGHSTRPLIASYDEKMDYWLHLSKWIHVYGKQSICVRIFPDSSHESFNLVEAFKSEIAEQVGQLNGSFVIPENRNKSWSWSAIEFVRIANQVAPDAMSKSEFHHEFVRMIDSLYSGGNKLIMSRSTAMSIVSIYAESNKRVCAELRPDRDSLFHEDFSRFPETDAKQQLTLETAVRIAIELILDNYSKKKVCTRAQTAKKGQGQRNSFRSDRLKRLIAKFTWQPMNRNR